MNKKVVLLNIIIAIISSLFLIRGIRLISNSGIIAQDMLTLNNYKHLQNYLADTKSTIMHLIDVIKLKGIIFCVFSLCGFIFSLININKELTK